MTIEEMRTIDAVKTWKELEEAKERIKRLEEAGDEMSHTCITIDADRWRKAKEAKL